MGSCDVSNAAGADPETSSSPRKSIEVEPTGNRIFFAYGAPRQDLDHKADTRRHVSGRVRSSDQRKDERALKSTLRSALAERFFAVNGRHEMTAQDDEYASRWYRPLEEVADGGRMSSDELATLMLAGALPMPSYIRSDGAFMVRDDLFELAQQAGGIDQLPRWFATQFAEVSSAVSHWVGYVNGLWVCLREATPLAMRRKDELVEAIQSSLAESNRDGQWRERLRALVDELDQIEAPFAPYDRLRFGGPVTRDLYVTAVRDEILAAEEQGAKTAIPTG